MNAGYILQTALLPLADEARMTPSFQNPALQSKAVPLLGRDILGKGRFM